MTFLKREKIPKDVFEKRHQNSPSLVRLVADEAVLLYRKRIKLKKKFPIQVAKWFSDPSIHDISIFNIEHFIQKMDNPEKPLY